MATSDCVYTLHFVFKIWMAKIKEKRKRKRYVWMNVAMAYFKDTPCICFCTLYRLLVVRTLLCSTGRLRRRRRGAWRSSPAEPCHPPGRCGWSRRSNGARTPPSSHLSVFVPTCLSVKNDAKPRIMKLKSLLFFLFSTLQEIRELRNVFQVDNGLLWIFLKIFYFEALLHLSQLSIILLKLFKFIWDLLTVKHNNFTISSDLPTNSPFFFSTLSLLFCQSDASPSNFLDGLSSRLCASAFCAAMFLRLSLALQ